MIKGFVQIRFHVALYRLLQSRPPVPWRAVFTSLPFWAILVAHTCSNWGWYMLLVELPIYMKSILNFDIKEVLFSLLLLFFVCLGCKIFLCQFMSCNVVLPYPFPIYHRTLPCRLSHIWACGFLEWSSGRWERCWNKRTSCPRQCSERWQLHLVRIKTSPAMYFFLQFTFRIKIAVFMR